MSSLPGRARGRPARVLLVDADVKCAMVLRRALGDEGYAVEACGSAHEALGHAQGYRFDAVVLDWVLPDIEGLQLLRAMRREGVGCPILIVTERADAGEKIAALDAGASDFVGKPFHVGELMARLRAKLRRAGAAAG